MSAHFQIYSPLSVSAAAQVRTIRWRLLASNSRPLAVSPASFPDFAGARLDVERFLSLLDGSEPRLTSGPDDRWAWTLYVLGSPIAQSVRTYTRRLECAKSVEHVLRLAPMARPPVVLRVFGNHRGRFVDPDAVVLDEDRGEATNSLVAAELPVLPAIAPKVVPRAPAVASEPHGSLTRALRSTAR